MPTVVPVGTWQIESDLLSYSWDERTPARDGVEEQTWAVASTLLTTGIAPRVDLQVQVDAYVSSRFADADHATRARGRGDLVLRAKWNFTGDEAHGPAFALLPYVKFPCGTGGVGNGEIEGGVLLPFGMPLSAKTSLNAMISADWAWAEQSRRLSTTASAAVIHGFTDAWGAYGELALTVDPRDSSEWQGLGGAGITWTCNERLAFDVGAYAGLTRAAPDVAVVWRLVYAW